MNESKKANEAPVESRCSADPRFVAYQQALAEYTGPDWTDIGCEPLTIDDMAKPDERDPVDPLEM